MDKNEILKFRSADEKNIPCRTCVKAIKGGICKGNCQAFEVKPLDIYFDNVPCPKYEEGEDLLKYEIQI